MEQIIYFSASEEKSSILIHTMYIIITNSRIFHFVWTEFIVKWNLLIQFHFKFINVYTILEECFKI